MKTRFVLILISIMSVGFATGWAASAWRFALPFGPMGGPPLPPDAIFQKLGLRADQQDRIEAIARKGREKERELVTQVETARRDLEEAVDANKELSSLQAKHAAFLSARDAVEKNHFDTMMQVHALLTLDQIHKLRSMRPTPPPPPRPE